MRTFNKMLTKLVYLLLVSCVLSMSFTLNFKASAGYKPPPDTRISDSSTGTSGSR